MTMLRVIIVWLAAGISSIMVADAMKHSFRAKHGKSLIGPVGIPFGYNANGHFELTVYNFQLKSRKKGSTINFDKYEPGFFLQKFDNEAEFNSYMEFLRSNNTICSFETFHYLNDFNRRNRHYKHQRKLDDYEGYEAWDDEFMDDGFMMEYTGDDYYVGEDIEGYDNYADEDDIGEYITGLDDDKADFKFTGDNNWDDDYDDQIGNLIGMDDDEYGIEAGGEILSAQDGIFLSMKNQKLKWKPNKPKIEYTFKSGEEGLYFLLYQVCPFSPEIYSSFQLDFHHYNIDSFGNKSYLSAGEMILPWLFFFFAVSYLLCFLIWFTNIQQINKGTPGHFCQAGERPVVYAIHQLMSVLLLLKFFSIFFESMRYFHIKSTGHAEVLSFIYYAVTFVKGTFLFTMILLIGSGWSFVKPFLNARERKIIIVILILQFVNNIAIIVLSQETEGEKSYAQWSGILHLVDIACCCAVLVPIVWQVNELEKSIGLEDENGDLSEREAALQDGDKGEILTKLKKFRAFYLIVVAYIYLTRILVYLFATLLDYRHLWVRHFVVEIVTLSFYVGVGFMFRPMSETKYQSVKSTDDDANGKGMELPIATKKPSNKRED